MTVLNLISIVSSGGSVIVDAKGYTALNLQSVARACKVKGANLIINNANGLTALNCQAIASVNPGHVYFNFC